MKVMRKLRKIIYIRRDELDRKYRKDRIDKKQKHEKVDKDLINYMKYCR